MLFTDIRLQNFRSYTDSSYEIGPGVNIVVGPNAIGKTNLLEALIYSAGHSSYRGKDESVIHHGKQWARIDTHTSDNQLRTTKLIYENAHIQREYELDQKKYKRFPITHKYPTVLFEPNDLFLLSAEPKNRREYLDNIIERFQPGYSTLLRRYKRIVAQRNSLLKQEHMMESMLFAWDVKLCEAAEQIIKARQSLLEEFNAKIGDVYGSVANKQSSVKMEYVSKVPILNYSTNLLKYLETNLETDKQRGFTSGGPHRDDIIIYLNNTIAQQHASRGEVRTLLLSLKILELDILEEKTNKKPLLLLDDVFSELDGARRKALTNYLAKHQTIITTTDADVVVQHFTESSNIIPLAER